MRSFLMNNMAGSTDKIRVMSTHFSDEFTNYEHRSVSSLRYDIFTCLECKQKGMTTGKYCYVTCNKISLKQVLMVLSV